MDLVALFVLVLLQATIVVCGMEHLAIVVISQQNSYNSKLVENTEEDLNQQALDLGKGIPKIYLTHRDLLHVGDWTVLPLIPKLAKTGHDFHWILFVQDYTKVRFDKLYKLLDQYDYKENIWLGHEVYDREATIIHHFMFADNPKSFSYPNLGSGFAISNSLFIRMANMLNNGSKQITDFSIDSAHELALYIWDKGAGPKIKHDARFCVKDLPDCALYPISYSCEGDLTMKNIYFAVKTCNKFHQSRCKVVKNTWGRSAHEITFFSDVVDDSIPTISMKTPNVEQGHCMKTMEILKYVSDEISDVPEIKWIAVADDDTVLSVSGLQQLLQCYNSSESVLLGERYGYNVNKPYGYNYITGGGGMVFSRKLLYELVEPGKCECPSASTPDDMYLGVCVVNLGLEVTHSPRFHQARPNDYAPEVLQSTGAVSFHKHWMIEPYSVYEEWFALEDEKLINSSGYVIHNEL